MPHVVPEPRRLPTPGKGANCASDRRDGGAVLPGTAVRCKCNTVSGCVGGQPLFADMGGLKLFTGVAPNPLLRSRTPLINHLLAGIVLRNLLANYQFRWSADLG